MRARLNILTVSGLLALAPIAHSQPWTFSTLAGNAGQGSADGNGGSARVSQPGGVAVDAGGAVYVADTANHTVRKISGGVGGTPGGRARARGGAGGGGGAGRGKRTAGAGGG